MDNDEINDIEVDRSELKGLDLDSLFGTRHLPKTKSSSEHNVYKFKNLPDCIVDPLQEKIYVAIFYIMKLQSIIGCYPYFKTIRSYLKGVSTEDFAIHFKNKAYYNSVHGKEISYIETNLNEMVKMGVLTKKLGRDNKPLYYINPYYNKK